jgi:hypothetical protein
VSRQILSRNGSLEHKQRDMSDGVAKSLEIVEGGIVVAGTGVAGAAVVGFSVFVILGKLVESISDKEDVTAVVAG